MTQTDGFGEELADFVRRVGELRTARTLPVAERLTVLDAALFELQHVADSLWPRFQQLASHSGGASGAPPADRQERQLLKVLFQRMPLPVALVDRETVVRRVNFAATNLTGVRAGYATGRPLAALLTHGDRAVFRSQAAAVARGEGDRSIVVHLQQRPDEPLLATLTALRPPDEPHPAVLVVLQPGLDRADEAASGRVGGHRRPLPDLTEAARHTELMDLVDTMASELLGSGADAGRDAVLAAAVRVLDGRFADWVVADSVLPGPLRRSAVCGTEEGLVRDLLEQSPDGCPLVVEVARGGSAALQVRPEDTEGFGRDGSGAPVLVRAGVTSLLCVPLTATGPVQGVLTLFRTGARRAFSMAEAQVMDVMSRHLALALAAAARRLPEPSARASDGTCASTGSAAPAAPGPADGCSSG